MEFSVGDEVTIKAKMLNHGYEFDPNEPFAILDIDGRVCEINAEIHNKAGSDKRFIVRSDNPLSRLRAACDNVILYRRRETIENIL